MTITVNARRGFADKPIERKTSHVHSSWKIH